MIDRPYFRIGEGQGVFTMNIEESAVREELQHQFTADPDGMIDLTRLWLAAGRPRSRSPLKWVTWQGLKPGVTALGGPDDEVWADQATARDYSHSLDPRIERGRITLSELRKRGWTDSLVERFLPECQATMTNPHYKTGPRIKLYVVARVQAIEASAAFQAAAERAKPRREASKRAAVTRKSRLTELIDRIAVAVPRFDWQTLIAKACKQYHVQATGPAPPTAREAEGRAVRLERLAVDYLRHVIMLNHRYVADRRGRLGVRLARTEFMRKVYDAIAETYPALKHECDRQRRDLDMRGQWDDR
jgi:hypothetical protein